ncbi:hypothetical protein ERJ75_001269500 [Trypanosoma vivax]|nr:hypothetical protein ERJ75_001269500 [Trypanosoma vivax]
MGARGAAWKGVAQESEKSAQRGSTQECFGAGGHVRELFVVNHLARLGFGRRRPTAGWSGTRWLMRVAVRVETSRGRADRKFTVRSHDATDTDIQNIWRALASEAANGTPALSPEPWERRGSDAAKDKLSSLAEAWARVSLHGAPRRRRRKGIKSRPRGR